MEWLNGIYLACFVFGLVFTIASFMLGNLADLAGADSAHAHIHAEGHGHDVSHGHDGDVSDTKAGGLGWFNFNALILFVTWFGATGFVLTNLKLNWLATLGLAFGGGTVGYFIVLLFLQKVLYASQTPYMQARDYDLAGTVGKVSSTIFPGGVGEVIFTKFGTTRSVSARSVSGQQIERGTEVAVLRVEGGIAYVEQFNTLLDDDFERQLKQQGQVNNNQM
jgi:membrane protein implicated in regulation of membrane protease activity